MQDIPFTQIIVLLAFILFPLINWLLQRMQRRFESQVPRRTVPQPAPRTFAKPPPIEVIAAVREPAPPAKLSGNLVSRRNQFRKSLFRSRRDLRRAIILMTVLGPCRANESSGDEARSFKQ